MATQSLFSLKAATLQGLDAIPVNVEVSVSNGLPQFHIVGMPDAAIQEARIRIQTALRSCGFSMPDGKVVVNLAPSSLKKTGSGFDLPITLCILAATKQIEPTALRNGLFVGELSLEGKIKPITGLLAYEVCARNNGWNLFCAQPDDGLLKLDDLEMNTVKTLTDFHTGNFNIPTYELIRRADYPIDYAEISGNEFAKRALQVAATGNHGVLMMGPPGSGKTMLAARLPTIMPPLTEPELLSAALIHSVAGENMTSILRGERPFRTPHHSATLAGLVGGGTPVRPGEISLAHNGVAFFDELAEFKPSVLQSVRQPIESGHVNIIRAHGKCEFPSRFMLVAASNPCPCGYYGDPDITCRCTHAQVRTYQNRIGGPLLDRLSIHLNVWRSKPEDILNAGKGLSSQELREGVLRGIEYRSFRCRNNDGLLKETPEQLLKACRLTETNEEYLKDMARIYTLSGRGLVKVLSVARTIADIDQREIVEKQHLCEALELRTKNTTNQN